MILLPLMHRVYIEGIKKYEQCLLREEAGLLARASLSEIEISLLHPEILLNLDEAQKKSQNGTLFFIHKNVLDKDGFKEIRIEVQWRIANVLEHYLLSEDVFLGEDEINLKSKNQNAK
ncbi:MAG: hypothetical protein HYS07_11215 [Chlamydiae bacterium]|nr:hypothetical protein [Chlamydiota bacterium]MBI3278191.1 hypothetical protein [Chlamydiota bacterium]